MPDVRRHRSPRAPVGAFRHARLLLAVPAFAVGWIGLHGAATARPALAPPGGTASPAGRDGGHAGLITHPGSALRNRSTGAVAAASAGAVTSSSLPAGQSAVSGGGPADRWIRADAYGTNVGALATCLSCTTAQAGPDGSGAEGRELRVAGENVSEGQVPANGYSSGALLVLPQNPLLRLAIAGWEGRTSADRNGSQAHARGALLELAPADGQAATVIAGESTSDASYGGRTPHGRGESNALRAGAGGRLTLVVLHSDSSSDSPGRVFVASMNGDEILPARFASGDHGLTVPGMTTLALLQSDGAGAHIGSASDGRSQRVVGIGTTRVGSPAADPQPLT